MLRGRPPSKDSKQSSASTESQLVSGSEINIALSKPLDAKRNRAGDQVFATTTQDVQSHGKVIIPKGSRVLGHLTEAKARTKGKSESALAIAFDKAVLKDGHEVPMNAIVQAVAASHSQAALDGGADDGMASQSAMASEAVRGGGGLLGGVGSTVGAVTHTTAGLGSSLGSASSATGSLSSSASGVAGLPGMALNTATATNASVISSATQNVHLQSGTQMLLHVR
jgi:hypothetical protein